MKRNFATLACKHLKAHISGDGIIRACFHLPYQDLTVYVAVHVSTCLLTRNSSPCHLHTCSNSLLTPMIGPQAATPPRQEQGQRTKKECLYHSRSDHPLLSLFPVFVQSHHTAFARVILLLGLGSCAGRALLTDLTTRMMGSGIASR